MKEEVINIFHKPFSVRGLVELTILEGETESIARKNREREK